MTSRLPQPGQRPQPLRSLSGSGMLQRQAQQRSHLNNQLGTPGSSKNNVVDLTNEPNSSTPSRPGPPSRVASGLRLETIVEAQDSSSTLDAQQLPSLSGPALPSPWPRGKPKLRFSYQNPPQSQDDTTNQSPSITGSSSSPQNAVAPKPLPFPPRPVRRGPQARDRSSELANAVPAQKKDKVPKPYVLEVPPVAPTCFSKFSLDFFPWTGSHPEDKFSQTIISNGYFDKLQMSHDKEYASLVNFKNKDTAPPPLKQPQSLKVLGDVFRTVINERRSNALITSAPTFKPPPRVTLTDTKKETWLKDLANPSIPLRRLSRTIPHGIKNKILLEQCMDKEVPMERAVWLAKCVGANEIRASKRTKGAPGAALSGGEAKWIRDWTVCVEQFVESTITLCGDAAHKLDGKLKLMYCVRLSSYLYSQKLLDSTHYLDYILASLESSNTAKLPARLFIAGLHAEHLLQYRKTGRRYVAALCTRLQIILESPDRDILQPVVDRIGSILRSILLSHPESFFSTRKWPQYKATMEECISFLGPEASRSLGMIDQRNSRLHRGLHNHHLLQGPRQEVISMLDSTLTILFTPELGKACWRAMKPCNELSRTVLEWATSRHRPGPSKVFVAARLLRVWSRHDLDVNEVALDFLGRASNSTTISRDAFYHLYSELTRSKHFSVSKYIHWLIARGGLRSHEDAAIDGPIATRLLAELPLCDVPEPILQLRKTLLYRASFPVEQEQLLLEDAWLAIEGRLTSFVGKEPGFMATSRALATINSISSLSRAVKAELGLRLRQLVKACTTGSQHASVDETRHIIEIDDFLFIRSILEQSSDIAMLADVLKLVSTSTSSIPNTLAECTDTVNVHRESLAAIGAFKDLFESLVGRYRHISMAHGLDTTALRTSLCELSAKIPEARELHIELAKDIARNMHKATVEACSPVSDHVVEVLQKNEASCSDEIEKVLDSGSSMDLSTFVRLFEVLVSQIEASWAKGSPGLQRYTALLGRLKTFEARHFSSMLTTWLDGVTQRAERPSITRILGPLISSECITFEEVLKSCSALFQGEKAGASEISTRIAMETLVLVLGSSHGGVMLQSGDSYKLNLKRRHTQSAHYPMILDITRHIIEMGQPFADGQTDAFTTFCGERSFVEFLQGLVISHFVVVTKSLVAPLAKSQDVGVLIRLRILLRSLLDLATPQTMASDLEPATRITKIISVASDLSLPFCQLALRSIFAGETSEKIITGDESKNGPSPLQAFENAINEALAAGNTTWTSILPLLDVQVARHLFESAERALVTELLANAGTSIARHNLFIVEATAYSMHGHRKPNMMMLLMEKVSEVVRHVTSGNNSPLGTNQHSMTTVMEVISLLTSDLTGIKQAAEIRSGLLMMLTNLHVFLNSKHFGTEELRQMAFDTILCLADEVDDSMRNRCVRQLMGHAPIEQSTPSASIGTPAIHSGNFATTPGGAGMSPAQATFQITAPPPLAASTGTTIAADPELCYALGFGKEIGTGLMLMQKGKMLPFQIKRWENLSEQVGDDTSLSWSLFEASRN